VPELRTHEGKPFLTDNGNLILDCRVAPLTQPGEREQAIRAIPGVVGTGLFLGMAHTVLIQSGSEVEVRHRGDS
jgi:ribose 5-phosphate isomerase A